MGRKPPPSPAARAGRLLLLVLLGGLVATSASVFLVYTFSSRVSSFAVEHEANAPSTTPASSDAPPAPAHTPVDDGFTLHPEDHVYREPKTIYLDWNITKEQRAPDGVVKSLYLINGPFPLPSAGAPEPRPLCPD